MSIFEKFLPSSPFKSLVEHARKVHECVAFLKPLTEALLNGNYEEIEELHHQMSKTEHDADLMKNEIRKKLVQSFLLSVGRYEIKRFVGLQDDIADAAEDYAVVLSLRNTKVPEELREDFLNFVNQIITVSEHFLALSEDLAVLVESGFAGEVAERVQKSIDQIGEEEWNADKLQRRFARHFYSIEEKLDPVTIMFLDKYCRALSTVANNAEKASKYLRQLIRS